MNRLVFVYLQLAVLTWFAIGYIGVGFIIIIMYLKKMLGARHFIYYINRSIATKVDSYA